MRKGKSFTDKWNYRMEKERESAEMSALNARLRHAEKNDATPICPHFDILTARNEDGNFTYSDSDGIKRFNGACHDLLGRRCTHTGPRPKCHSMIDRGSVYEQLTLF